MPYFVTISGKSNNLINKKNQTKLLKKKKGKEEEEEIVKSLFQNTSNICLQVFEVSHLIKA